jgi:hypothetical protein
MGSLYDHASRVPSDSGLTPVHLITWLARVVTDAGVPPGQLSGVAIPALQKKTGGQEIDPVVAGYWE